MIFQQAENVSITRGAIIYIILIVSWTVSIGQESRDLAALTYNQVYEATQTVLLNDPVIQNGVYYSYPYYNAIGHPFLGQKEFDLGSVVFREKLYGDLSINYDLFNQQLILSREYEGVLQMNLLAIQFVSGFYLKDKQFIKADFQGGVPEFFQVIAETGTISCYYAWYKERREVRDSGNRSIFSFSDQRSKRYLLLDGQLARYKNNKSFLRIFPDAGRTLIKDYLQENQLLVLDASDQAMGSLIGYCDRVLNQVTNRGGE